LPDWSGYRWLGFGGLTLVAIAAALAVAGAVLVRRGPAQVLALRPVVWLGGISYAFYLWHYPITLELESHFGARFGRLPVAVLAIAVTTGFAWASARFVERPATRARGLLEARHRRVEEPSTVTPRNLPATGA
jgi:peptidoglycan/LPS O-acetylase OafA/YrhL